LRPRIEKRGKERLWKNLGESGYNSSMGKSETILGKKCAFNKTEREKEGVEERTKPCVALIEVDQGENLTLLKRSRNDGKYVLRGKKGDFQEKRRRAKTTGSPASRRKRKYFDRSYQRGVEGYLKEKEKVGHSRAGNKKHKSHLTRKLPQRLSEGQKKK